MLCRTMRTNARKVIRSMYSSVQLEEGTIKLLRLFIGSHVVISAGTIGNFRMFFAFFPGKDFIDINGIGSEYLKDVYELSAIKNNPSAYPYITPAMLENIDSHLWAAGEATKRLTHLGLPTRTYDTVVHSRHEEGVEGSVAYSFHGISIEYNIPSHGRKVVVYAHEWTHWYLWTMPKDKRQHVIDYFAGLLSPIFYKSAFTLEDYERHDVLNAASGGFESAAKTVVNFNLDDYLEQVMDVYNRIDSLPFPGSQEDIDSAINREIIGLSRIRRIPQQFTVYGRAKKDIVDSDWKIDVISEGTPVYARIGRKGNKDVFVVRRVSRVDGGSDTIATEDLNLTSYMHIDWGMTSKYMSQAIGTNDIPASMAEFLKNGINTSRLSDSTIGKSIQENGLFRTLFFNGLDTMIFRSIKSGVDKWTETNMPKGTSILPITSEMTEEKYTRLFIELAEKMLNRLIPLGEGSVSYGGIIRGSLSLSGFLDNIQKVDVDSGDILATVKKNAKWRNIGQILYDSGAVPTLYGATSPAEFFCELVAVAATDINALPEKVRSALIKLRKSGILS